MPALSWGPNYCPLSFSATIFKQTGLDRLRFKFPNRWIQVCRNFHGLRLGPYYTQASGRLPLGKWLPSQNQPEHARKDAEVLILVPIMFTTCCQRWIKWCKNKQRQRQGYRFGEWTPAKSCAARELRGSYNKWICLCLPKLGLETECGLMLGTQKIRPSRSMIRTAKTAWDTRCFFSQEASEDEKIKEKKNS